jgi:subtilase family serine protease
MLTPTPAVRRRLASLLALALTFPLALGACATSVVDKTPTKSPTKIASSVAGSGVCPTESASSAFGGQTYTPRQMRVAYGVESLCQQGYTGKGQAVVLIESFGSPTM